MPDAVRIRLQASRELVRRWLLEDISRDPVLESPKAVRQYLSVHYAGHEREVFCCLFLDNRHRLIALEEMFQGTIDGASVHPREVVKRALRLNSAAVILARSDSGLMRQPMRSNAASTRRAFGGGSGAHAAMAMVIGSAGVSPCSRRSARTRSASACVRERASSRVAP